MITTDPMAGWTRFLDSLARAPQDAKRIVDDLTVIHAQFPNTQREAVEWAATLQREREERHQREQWIDGESQHHRSTRTTPE